MSDHIFVSYSKKDSEFAHKLADKLEAGGFRIWIDREISGGDQWRQSIDTNLRTAREVVVVVSQNSIASRWVTHETAVAIGAVIPVVPILIEDVANEDLPVYMDEIHYIDFRDWRNEGFPRAYAALKEALTPPNPIQDLLDQQVSAHKQTGEMEFVVAARGVPYWFGPECFAEVLKVAHHGSDTSTSASFLATVRPDEAVISVGDQNIYGHPDQAVLDRLTDAGARIWRTDELGTTVVISDGALHEIRRLLWDIFLPLVVGETEPTETVTPEPSPRPQTQTATLEAEIKVVISDIFYDGVAGSQEPDEYVELRNDGQSPTQLEGWTLSDEADHVYTFPAYLIAVGEVCRVYTNEVHAVWCGFSYGSGSAIWNNGGDCATLRDEGGDWWMRSVILR